MEGAALAVGPVDQTHLAEVSEVAVGGRSTHADTTGDLLGASGAGHDGEQHPRLRATDQTTVRGLLGHQEV